MDIYILWTIHRPSMRSLGVIFLKISCLQCSDLLTSFDPKWPLDSTKNNMDYPLNISNPHACIRSPTVTVLELQCLQGFDHLISADPKWPLTSIKNNRDHLLNVGNLHAKYEILCCYPCRDTVFTKFWPFDLWWPQMTFDLHQKQQGSFSHY